MQPHNNFAKNTFSVSNAPFFVFKCIPPCYRYETYKRLYLKKEPRAWHNEPSRIH